MLEFDCALIIIDALDECGVHAREVVDGLASLREKNTGVKTLFLSRNEIDIRCCFGDYEKLSICGQIQRP